MSHLLFSDSWMQELAKFWNSDQTIEKALAGQKFDAKIGYGFTHALSPAGILIIRHNKVQDAGLYQAQSLDWDLRAEVEDWQSWLEEGLGLARLGFAVAHNKLQFKTGDYRQMLRTPTLATAFLRSFELMGHITTEFTAYF